MAAVTEKALLNVLYQTKPKPYSLRGLAESSQSNNNQRNVMAVDCDEVYSNLFIGDAASAKNKAYLQNIGITHVLNTAEGKAFGMVDTCADFYQDTRIVYLGLKVIDQPTTNIAQYFETAVDFIESGLKSGGKVLVHCLMGMSRSSTCVLAYLMIKEKMSAVEAIKTIREHREIRPNNGFLVQLAKLDNNLSKLKGNL